MAKSVKDPVFGTLTWDAVDHVWVAALPVDYFKKFGGALPVYKGEEDDGEEGDPADEGGGDEDGPEGDILKAMSSLKGFFGLLKETDEFKKRHKLPPEEREQFDQMVSRMDDLAEAVDSAEELDPQDLFAEGKFKVTVASGPKGPTAAQRDAWQRVRDGGDELWGPVLKRLFETYQAQRPVRVRWWKAVYGARDKALPAALPELKSAAGLKKLIRPLEFRVHEARKGQKSADVGVHFDAAWDGGDGFGVLLREGEVVAVGVEAVALEPPPEEPTVDHPVFGRLRKAFDDEWTGTVRFEPFRELYNVAEERETHRRSAQYDLPREGPPWDYVEGNFELTVHLPSKKGPSKEQEETFRAFTADPERSAREVLDAIFRFYRDAFDDLRQDLDDEDADRMVPLIKSAEGLRELITFQGMSVYPGDRKRGPSLGLSFDCTWDEEHGLGVRWRDGKVEEVGQADVA